MKKIVYLILGISIVFCSCVGNDMGNSVSGVVSGSAVNNIATGSIVSGGIIDEKNVKEKKSPTVQITLETKNKPIISSKMDLTKKGVELFISTTFATGMRKGDDGNIYYFRYQKKGKDKKIIIYRNNGVKVCETKIPEKYRKDCGICSFAKYGDTFWFEFDSDGGRDLVPLLIKDGRWGKEVTVELSLGRIIIYEGSFYKFDIEQGMVHVINRKGKNRSFALAEEGVMAVGQMIIDDKLYYITRGTACEKIMRCNLDGSRKEELFRYSGKHYINEEFCTMDIDRNYIYLHMPYCNDALLQISQNEGNVKVITEATDWYDMSEDSIYYVNELGAVCRVDKELNVPADTLTNISVRPGGDIPFLYADRHLLVEGYNKDERKMINVLWATEIIEVLQELSVEYANECYWINGDGRIEYTIQGTGLDKGWHEIYQETLNDLEEDLIEDEYYLSGKEAKHNG